MAPKKEICLLGAVQEHGDGWRAEVSNVGKGPTRALHAEAFADLTQARQAVSREDMGRVLRRLVAESSPQLLGQPLAANAEADARDRSRSRST